MRSIILSLLLWTTVFVPVQVYAQDRGEFQGRLITRWDDNGREMTLQEEFVFVDTNTKSWIVPRGATVNGASIPRAMWSIFGGPFAGKYRRASVIHDHYCETKSRPWKDVHRVFFDAMITAGVGERKAKLMYAAVYHFGPRWKSFTVRFRDLFSTQKEISTIDQTPQANDQRLQHILSQAGKNNLSLEEIERLQ